MISILFKICSLLIIDIQLNHQRSKNKKSKEFLSLSRTNYLPIQINSPQHLNYKHRPYNTFAKLRVWKIKILDNYSTYLFTKRLETSSKKFRWLSLLTFCRLAWNSIAKTSNSIIKTTNFVARLSVFEKKMGTHLIILHSKQGSISGDKKPPKGLHAT